MADKSKRISLSSKFALYNNLLMAIVLIVSIGAFYYFFNVQATERFRVKLMDVAKSAAVTIDVSKHEKLKTIDDEQTQEYKEIKKVLQKFRDANSDVKYIYTMRKIPGDNNNWQFVVDADDSNDMSHIGDKYDISKDKFEEMRKAFDGPAADKQSTTDDWGEFYSGYAPVRDKDGKAVAIVGVDVSAKVINEEKAGIFEAASIILLVIIIVSTISTRYLANQFFKPVLLIKEQTARLKREKEFNLDLQTNDEFAEIAAAIDIFASEATAASDSMQKELKSSELEKNQFYSTYSDLIKALTGGKLRLATRQEMRIYLSDGTHITDMPISEEGDINKITEFVQKYGNYFAEEKFNKIKTSIIEAVNNVIKHAQAGMLNVISVDGKLRFVISDSGPGMPLNKIPHNIFTNIDGDNVPEKGFSLLYKNADYIIFNTSGQGTILVIDFAFKDGNAQEIIAEEVKTEEINKEEIKTEELNKEELNKEELNKEEN